MVRVHADHVVAVSRRRDASVDPISDANGHIPRLSPPNLCRKHQVSSNSMRRSDSAKGSGPKNRPLNTLKIAALLAIPKAEHPDNHQAKPRLRSEIARGLP